LGWRQIASAVAVIICVEAIFAICLFISPWDMEKRGQFGDMFGALNAAFSGLAFCGIIYTIFLQRKELQLQRRELQLQREELVATRGELQRTAAAQEAAERALNSQAQASFVSARMTAINNMITATTIQQEKAKGSSDWARANDLNDRIGELYRELEGIYSEVTSYHLNNSGAP